jgi:hypothetical protein
VRFEIEGRVSPIGQCHCSLCRKASGTGSNAVLLTARRSFRWAAGEERIELFTKTASYTASFCRVCGSPVPNLRAEPKVVSIPAGSLDDDPGTRVEQHIYVGSRAAWDEIAGDAPHYEEGAPPYRKA